MSREIRRVPANWQHPTYRTERWGRGIIETFKPLLDGSFAKVSAEWDEKSAAWDRGERPDYFDAEKYGDISFIDWDGERPNQDWYVPYDVDGDLPWFQMYETVSEGTPVTPAFATAEELIEHLSTIGETHEGRPGDGPWPRDRAEKFVKSERWFPSLVIQGGVIYTAKDGFPK